MKIVLNRNNVDKAGDRLCINKELILKYYELKKIETFIYQKQQKCNKCGNYQINNYDLLEKSDPKNLTGTIKISLEFLGDKNINGNLISSKAPDISSISRTDECLIRAIEELDQDYPPKIIEIPDGTEWKIAYKPYHYDWDHENGCTYEFTEYIEEKHKTWGLE